MIDNHLPKNVMGGGGTPNHKKLMKELKKHYWRAFLVLIKAYKRYYLGAWIIKLPFYRLTSNQHQFIKWQAKRDERLEFLHNALKTFKFLSTFDEESKKWLNSPEFKAKYLDTKHPYPPLLNPDSVDYKSIPAELAWDINLPLPKNYDLIFLTNGASASAATSYYLAECSCRLSGSCYEAKATYLSIYKSLQFGSKCKFNVIALFVEDIVQYPNVISKNSHHLLSAISKKVPLLYVARDPIERAKHIINHIQNDGGISSTPLMKKFNLTCDYTKLFPKFAYFGSTLQPSFVGLTDYEVEIPFLYTRLLCDSPFTAFKDKISSIYCVEFNDLKPDKAFDTFCKVADVLDLDKPQNKEIFLNRMSPTAGMLALFGLDNKAVEIYIHLDDINNVFVEGNAEKQNLNSLGKKGGYSIFIAPLHILTKEQREFVDISDEISNDLIVDDTQILMVIQQDDFKKLQANKELWNATKQYLKGYVQCYKDKATKMKSDRVSEQDLLNYLRTNKKARNFIKKTLDNELNYIKEHHPNFIEKWKYYLEFEKMCAELDGEKDEK